MLLYGLLLCSILSTTIYSTLNSRFSRTVMKGQGDFYLFNTIVSVPAAILFLILSRGLQMISLYTVLIGIVFAVMTMGSQFATIKAMHCGPMSYTVMFSSCGMIIPAVAGVLFWRENFSWLQALGAAVLVVSFVTGANFKKHQNITLKWLCYALVLFLCAGLVGIVQKIHQSSAYKDELFSLLFVNFAIMGVLSFLLYLRERKRRPEAEVFRVKGKILAGCILIGILVAFSNAANLFLSGKMASMFFCPAVNGGSTVLCGLISYFFLKEKLDRTQLISFGVGIIGLVCLGIG